jgi:surface polysaccharide O-acyltransferase-like enzyme
MKTTAEEKISKQQMVGLEYLRVFFMISVVAFHSGLSTELAIYMQGGENVHVNIFDVISYNLQSIAVPCFFIISNFLFCLKPISRERLTSRLKRLASLYIFWVALIVYHYRPEVEYSLMGLTCFLVCGGQSFYYFIAVLILLSPVTFLVQKMHGRSFLIAASVSALVLLSTIVWLQQDYYFARNLNHCIVTSYALVPLCAVLLSRYYRLIQSSEKFALQCGLALIFAGVVLAYSEWQFAAPGEVLDDRRFWLPKHARFSLYLFASALVIFAIRIRSEPSRLIGFLSKNSLGIYCLHGFCIGKIIVFSKKFLPQSMSSMGIAIGCILTLICCAAASEFLRSALKRRLI